jgi:glycosyltransferase involved in cell wall biosynthesis
MKLLIVAYACEPNKGSEPEVGWRVVNEISKLLPEDEIYVITKANNKETIEKEKYSSNIKFFYYELPKKLTFWKKGGRGVRTYYYLWMIGAYKYLQRQKINFDIIHHVTFVNDWLPSFFINLKNSENKFIWGPIGGNDPLPEKFLPSNKKTIEKIRILLQKIFRNDPMFLKCKKNADVIMGINYNVKNKLKLKKDKTFIVEPAIALSKLEIINNKYQKSANEFFILSVGRFIYIKNFKLTIDVFYEFLRNNPNSNAKLILIGDGPDKNMLIDLVKKYKIEDKVIFTGKISRSEVFEYMKKSHLFLFPTLENAGFVILEAMSNFMPVLALNYGGPAQFIIKNKDLQLANINMSYDEIKKDLANKIELFYNDSVLRKKTGIDNHNIVLKNFTWEEKAKKYVDLYKRLFK